MGGEESTISKVELCVVLSAFKIQTMPPSPCGIDRERRLTAGMPGAIRVSYPGVSVERLSFHVAIGRIETLEE